MKKQWIYLIGAIVLAMNVQCSKDDDNGNDGNAQTDEQNYFYYSKLEYTVEGHTYTVYDTVYKNMVGDEVMDEIMLMNVGDARCESHGIDNSNKTKLFYFFANYALSGFAINLPVYDSVATRLQTNGQTSGAVFNTYLYSNSLPVFHVSFNHLYNGDKTVQYTSENYDTPDCDYSGDNKGKNTITAIEDAGVLDVKISGYPNNNTNITTWKLLRYKGQFSGECTKETLDEYGEWQEDTTQTYPISGSYEIIVPSVY